MNEQRDRESEADERSEVLFYLPINISAVLSTGSEFWVQLDTCKCAFLSSDGANETHGSGHITRDIYILAQVDLTARASAGRNRGHAVWGACSVQNTGDGVALTVIRDGGKGPRSKSSQ